MQAHIHKLKCDYTSSINTLNEIMKGNLAIRSLAIDAKYGKNNPIYAESSKKKSEAILNLTHSVHKPGWYSDLSTNSRSSVNNTFYKKRQLTPSKSSLSDKLFKGSKSFSTRKRSTKKRKIAENYDLLNRQATFLIERSIVKPIVNMGPKRKVSLNRKLDLSGAFLEQPVSRFTISKNIKRVRPNLPLRVGSAKTRKRSLNLGNSKAKQPASLQNSMDTSESYKYETISHFYPNPLLYQTPTGMEFAPKPLAPRPHKPRAQFTSFSAKKR